MKDIYNLELHERVFIKKLQMTLIRVAGGWIYQTHVGEHFQIGTSVFVPFNDEFQRNITNEIFMLEREIDQIELYRDNPDTTARVLEIKKIALKQLKDEKANK